LKIAAKINRCRYGKALQLTVYRKSIANYSMAPSPTSYDLPFRNNTFVADGQTERQTDRRTTDDSRKIKLNRYLSTVG